MVVVLKLKEWQDRMDRMHWLQAVGFSGGYMEAAGEGTFGILQHTGLTDPGHQQTERPILEDCNAEWCWTE